MSRLRLYVRGVTTSYLALASNILYTLMSVPLVLHYLTSDEYGCWTLVVQVVSYVSLIDLGMTPAMARLLVEHKDQRTEAGYGSLIQTGMLVTVTQGVLIFVVGWLLAPFVAALLRVNLDLRGTFVILLRWECSLTGLAFALRLPRSLLFANQRTDWFNYIQIAGLGVGFMALWISLSRGAGIYSVIWTSTGILGTVNVGGLLACWRLRLLPARNQWGRPNARQFRELFRYGRDVFVVHLGSLLIMASQQIVITRTLGLAAVATWSVGTRVFTLSATLLWQLFDMSTPAFSEMLVHHETVRLRQRFTDLVAVSANLAVIAGSLIVACNTPFVALWTHGRIAWSPLASLLLGLWLVAAVIIHATSGLVVLSKHLSWLRAVFILEGVLFITVGLFLARHGGLPAIIGASIITSVLLSGAYSAWRVNCLFGQKTGTLELAWLWPASRTALVLGPLALAVRWLTHSWAPLPTLALAAPVLGGTGLGVLILWGVPEQLRPGILGRAPAWAGRILQRLWPAFSAGSAG